MANVTNIFSVIGVFSNLLAFIIGFILTMLGIAFMYNNYNQENTRFNKLSSFYGVLGLTFFTAASVFAALISHYFMSFNATYTIFGNTLDRWAWYDICYFFCLDIGQVCIYLFLINRLKISMHGLSKTYYFLFNLLSIINLILGFYGIVIIFRYQSYNSNLSNQERLILSDIPIFSGLIISLFLTFIIIYLFIHKALQIVVDHKLHHTFDANGNHEDDMDRDDGYDIDLSPVFSDTHNEIEISIMTMSSDLFNVERSQETILNATASIIVVSAILLIINILYLIYISVWYGLYEITNNHDRFRHMREAGVMFSGFAGIIDNLCIYISLDCSSKWYNCFCGCFHRCWLHIAQNYAEKRVQKMRINKQPFLSACSSRIQHN